MSGRPSALLLDAGNTVVFLDMGAVAAVAAAEGVDVSPARLSAVEGAAKRRYEARLGAGGSHESGWRLYLETLLTEAGVDAESAPGLIAPLRAAHDELNLWRRVPDDLPRALTRARAMGIRLGVISNSEGRLDALFAHVGLGDAFEVVVDSAHEGVRKPDPAIFHRAVARMGVDPGAALYAGDIPSVDVDGALGAGLRAALIDPLDFYPAHEGSPRYASVAALVEDLARAPSR
ncbi:MAG TPA: HAD family hydrolase [Sandaracinaceae bacterium LLY-WYZ-13_1]|nr:HAD family hydrolase [Sandaracinaceae bacterium LLY-WYZ-13_1]